MFCNCCKKTTATDGEIENSDLVEPTTSNNLAKINGNMLRADGFDTEVLQLVYNDGNIKRFWLHTTHILVIQ